MRFHIYWAGSDRDGAVAGFYWAVVETLPRPQPGEFFVPSLPGPRPQDYHYTTRSDSFFIFNVAEDIPDRQHAFFIYAVDNLGKGDPTPARFIFNAQDRFPPIPKFDDCTCEGTVYELVAGGGVRPIIERKTITDIDVRTRAPRDTCAANSTLTFRWHAEVQVPQTQVIGFRYKLDEPELVHVGPEVTSVTYNSGIAPDTIPPSPGVKIFLLRAVDQAFGTRDSTRRFQLNYAPETWYSGPDPNSPTWQVKGNGEKYVPFVNRELPAGGILGSLMSPDSMRIFPAFRPVRRTFMEVFRDTLYLRQEGDTVHMNSWVIVHGGGYDRDSRYSVRVSDIMWNKEAFPDFPTRAEAPVFVRSSLPNGSPIGLKSIVTMALTPTNSPSNTALSNLYPVIDPNDVFHNPQIAGYHPVFQAGRAFLLMQAEDSDGDRDKRVADGRDLVVRVENGTATPYEQSLRDQVLTFHVNKAPRLSTENPVFRPRAAVVDTFKTQNWDLRLPAFDPDPYRPLTAVGGPSNIVTFRRRLSVEGLNAQGLPITFVEPTPYTNQETINLVVPGDLAAGPATLVVELCDCDQCEVLQGSGRCITTRIPVYYQPSGSGRPAP